MTEPAGGAAGGEAAEPPRGSRGPMNWLIDFIELVAAAFIGIVAADIFISVMLRYFFSV
jgi:TRAP-type transport system small permease protein